MANKNYFEEITKKIDKLEHPELYPEAVDANSYGEVDGNSSVTVTLSEPAERVSSDDDVENSSQLVEIQNNLPQIDADRIDGVISLYKEFNAKYGLKFDADKINSIGGTFKAIMDPKKKEIFEIYLREYIDRLRLVCINQLGNTVYSLIAKLTSEETIRSLTITERVALLDRLFEYMDKVNNMVAYIPKGDTNTELREIAQRIDDEETGAEGSSKPQRNRELESFILGLLKGKKDDSKNV